MDRLSVEDSTQRWLALCGLDGPNANGRLVRAACADLDESAELLLMLQADPVTFFRWWYKCDHAGWLMTAETGGTDWAWLVLARLGFEVRQSPFGVGNEYQARRFFGIGRAGNFLRATYGEAGQNY